MSTDNNAIVKKAKQVLKEKGIELKTTEVYELLSKISNYPNWNVAQSKNVNFSEVLSEFNVDLKLKNTLCVGFQDNFSRKPILLNLDSLPYFLMVGSKGSGKTYSMISVLKSWKVNNDLSEVFVHNFDNDPVFKDVNQHVNIVKTSNIKEVVGILYEESLKRLSKIKDSQCRDLLEYEKYSKEDVKRIIFSTNSMGEVLKEVSFFENYNKIGTDAFKLKELLSNRGSGICLIGELTEDEYSRLSSLIRLSENCIQFFRCNNKNSRTIDPLNIRADEKGKCFLLSEGFVQYPK